ncbi:MAG: ComF family protein, partial [Lancefieldella parvula]|nr:ComF family protein [Lancefieldella parvula]
MQPTSILTATANSTLDLLAPTRCVVCEKPGQLLCDECRAKLPWISQQWACPNCGAPYGKLVCSECADKKKRPVQWES